MKYPSLTRVVIKCRKQSAPVILLLLCLLTLLPQLGISQPSAPGGGGGNPDTPPPTPPPSVPFDWKLNLILLAAGILLAVSVLKKCKENNLQIKK